MRSSAEFSIDFSAEELLQESGPAQTATDASPMTQPQKNAASPTANDADSIEIELTPEQIDALLDGKF